MLVIEKVKALALKLKNPAVVMATVATAKPLHVRGMDVVIVPHKLDEVRVLRNMGIEAPSPIMHYYDWPGRWTPYKHQKETAAFLTLIMRGLVLNEIGTGKTDSALWAADYLMSIGAVKRCLIISPLSTLERVWGDAVFTQMIHRKAAVLHGDADYRRKLLKTDADFFIVNHDGFPIIAKEAIDMFDLVIIDEAAVYRNPSTNRFKLFKRWMDLNPNIRLWLMTGTPTPNEPTDAWALAKLVNSPFCTGTYTAFKNQVMFKQGMYRWLPRADSINTVQHILQPSVRYTRDECFDLPDTIYSTRKVALTPEQQKHYSKMLKSFFIEAAAVRVGAGTITAVNEAVKLGKLVQIACGVAYDDNGNYVELDCKPRVQEVINLIEQAGEKVIVFVPLTGTLEMLERELAKKFTVAVVNGGVSAAKRNIIFQNFQDDVDPQVLLAHPATMAHGLTLTSASTIIWYGPITSNEQYVQANGRVERIGKRHISNVIHIEGTELEHKMYQRLKNKQTLQGLLLELIQNQTKG